MILFYIFEIVHRRNVSKHSKSQQIRRRRHTYIVGVGIACLGDELVFECGITDVITMAWLMLPSQYFVTNKRLEQKIKAA